MDGLPVPNSVSCSRCRWHRSLFYWWQNCRTTQTTGQNMIQDDDVDELIESNWNMAKLWSISEPRLIKNLWIMNENKWMNQSMNEITNERFNEWKWMLQDMTGETNEDVRNGHFAYFKHLRDQSADPLTNWQTDRYDLVVKCEDALKEGQRHSTTVADGWAGAIMQKKKTLAIQQGQHLTVACGR